MPTPIYYHFQQRFNVSARKAYEWCTSFSPGDHALMGETDASRKIGFLTGRTIILTDRFGQTEKQKLIQLYPETLFWTSTHITGPARHSQFLYRVNAESETASRLDFTGIFLDYEHDQMSEADGSKLADKTRAEDAAAWALLAKAMEQDLCKE